MCVTLAKDGRYYFIQFKALRAKLKWIRFKYSICKAYTITCQLVFATHVQHISVWFCTCVKLAVFTVVDADRYQLFWCMARVMGSIDTVISVQFRCLNRISTEKLS